MAITRPLVFTNVGIGDATGATPNFYPLHVSESATVTVTPTTDTIDNGQTLTSFYDVSVEFVSFNANVINDARVYNNATATPVLGSILLQGAAGAQNINVTGVYINSERVFDGNRSGIRIFATKRGVSDAQVITLT
jgi:hypothetical protein